MRRLMFAAVLGFLACASPARAWDLTSWQGFQNVLTDNQITLNGTQVADLQQKLNQGGRFDAAGAGAIASALISGKNIQDVLNAYLGGQMGAGTVSPTGAILGGAPDPRYPTDRSRIGLPEMHTNSGDPFRGITPAEGGSETGVSPTSMKGGSVITASPLASFYDIVNSKVHTDQVLDLLGSTGTVAFSTMFMTEPAVGAAWNAVGMQAAMQLNNRYLADIHFMQQAQAYPQIGQPMMQAYLGCLARRIGGHPIALTSQGVSVGTSFDKLTWIEAQSLCMRDRTGLFGGIQRFDKDMNGPERYGLALAGMDYGDGFIAADDPNWYEGENSTLVFDRDKTTISLWSYLFPSKGQLTELDPPAGAGLPDARTRVNQIRVLYQQVVGNLIFSFGSGRDGLSRRTFSITKQPGLLTSSQYLQKSVKDSYDNILNLTRDYCNYLRILPPQTSSDSPFENPGSARKYIDQGDGFWRNPAAGPGTVTDRLRALSFPGFWFKPTVGKNIYSLVEKRLGDFPKCDMLNPAVAGTFMYRFEDLAFNANGVTPTETSAKNVKLEQRMFFYLAKKIAFGQMFAMLIRAEDYVERSVNGTFNDSLVRDSALQMLYDVAGTNDLRGAAANNLRELQEVITMMNSKVELDKKREGLNIAGPVRPVAETPGGGSFVTAGAS